MVFFKTEYQDSCMGLGEGSNGSVFFHNLYLSSRNIPTVIIMDDETENKGSEGNETRPQNIIEKCKEKRLLARRNKYGENS